MAGTEVRELAEAPPAAYAPPAITSGDSPPAAGPSLPRDTTPTWELELLVSGAVLFGLFQVPPLILTTYARYRPHFGMVGSAVAAPVAMLALTLFYGLIGCFVLHLVLRAYWVALVGVHSVFPHGVRWEKQREYGPFQTRLHQERVRPLPEFIGRADNAASMVFATGFVLAATVLASAAFLALAALVVWLLVLALGRRTGLLVGGVLYMLATLPLALAPIVDLKYGERIDPAGRLGRVLRAVLRVVVGPVPTGVRSMSSVLSSNVNKRVVWGATAVAFAGAFATAFAHLWPSSLSAVIPSAGGLRYFADAAPGTSMPALRYDTFRGDAEPSDRVPSIDGDVAAGPYVRLFVPYRADVHDAALRRVCPALAPLDHDDVYAPRARAAADSVLRCAARVHRVTLDGRALDALRFRFLADPRTNRRGFLAYVPVAALPPGEHVLAVARAALADGAPPPPYEILFWK